MNNVENLLSINTALNILLMRVYPEGTTRQHEYLTGKERSVFGMAY